MATLALSDADVALWRRKIFTEINVELDVPWFVICGQQLFAAKKIVKETFDGFAIEEKTHFFLVSISMIPQSLFFSISLCASILSLSLFLSMCLYYLSLILSLFCLSLCLFFSLILSLFLSRSVSILSLSFSLSFCLYCLSLSVSLFLSHSVSIVSLFFSVSILSLSLSLSLSLCIIPPCVYSLSLSCVRQKASKAETRKKLKSKSLLIWRN